ncbi:MAG: hypothetical protein QXI16_06835, partial [Sulfolobaceae archaeon]
MIDIPNINNTSPEENKSINIPPLKLVSNIETPTETPTTSKPISIPKINDTQINTPNQSKQISIPKINTQSNPLEQNIKGI